MKPFDANGLFRRSSESVGLRRTAVRGAGVTVLAGGASFAIQMVATIVLARLLAPAAFGIVTMVTTFSLLFCSFGLNGFTELIVQREDITNDLATNLFWINVGVGVVLTGLFASLGPLIARFYHNLMVAQVTAGMSLTILAGSFSVIHLALLNRAMRFTAVSINSIVARAASVVVSIVLALAGWGYWALVGGYMAQQVSTSLGAWLMCRWVPGVPRRAPGTGESVKFALNVYSHFTLNYFSGNTDNLLVGWRFGAAGLGFYKKAFDLFCLPACQLLSPMGAVVVATLSRFNRNRADYQRYFLSGFSVLALIGMGIGADLTLVGKDLIRLLMGPLWGETGRIFSFFGPGIGVMLLYGTHGWIHLSIGRPERWFRWAVFEFLWTVCLFVVGLHWGPAGIAAAWTTSYFTLMLPAFWYAGKPIGLKVTSILGIIWKFLAASVGAGCGTAWCLRALSVSTDTPFATTALVRLLSVSVLFFIIYLGLVVVLHRGFDPLRQAARVIADFLPERREGSESVVGAARVREQTEAPEAVG